MDYELTQLRKLFVEEMEVLNPEWMVIKKESALKADFELAVRHFDSMWGGLVGKWLDEYKNGDVKSLVEIFSR